MKQNDNIEMLTACEAIRRRPAMYIGDLTRGLQWLIHELIKSAIEPQFANNCTVLQASLYADSSFSIADDGSGISVTPRRPPIYNTAPVIEEVLTELLTGQPDYEAYRHLSYLFNVGVIINALSEWLTVETVKDGVKYVIHCARGKVTDP